jgi:uncharacterized phage-like protein YoqJ
MNDRQNSCCISGHRPKKLPFRDYEDGPDCRRLMMLLASEVDKMLENGVTSFLTGMAPGTDIIAARIVLEKRRDHSADDIRLIAVVPYEGQADQWPEIYRERYFRILSLADEVVTLYTRKTDTCIREVCRYMVDACDHLIAVYNGSEGGTQYTIDYAAEKGRDIVVINPDTLKREHITPSEPLLSVPEKATVYTASK